MGKSQGTKKLDGAESRGAVSSQEVEVNRKEKQGENGGGEEAAVI